MTRELEDYQRRDTERLAELHTSEDPRSIAEMIADDSYDTIIVDKAERDGDRTTISWDHGMTTSVKGPEVKIGDSVRFYGGARLGDMRHGWALNGEVIEWQTPWERFAKRIEMLAEHDRKRRERAEAERAQVDEWLPLLHGPYRERIERFRREKPDFDLNGGTYEVYPVLMAQRIEAWVRERHPDAKPATWGDAVALVKELESLPYDEQSPVLHAGADDKYGVSGHQVGSAFGMAARVLMGAAV